MTALRQRMIEDMQLRGLSEKTQESYVRAVRQLAEHYKSPDQISEEELRQYFLYLKNSKRVSRSAFAIALCGIKFFYQHSLQREWVTLELARAPKEKRLPVVLSQEEVQRILGGLRLPGYRVCLSTIYACGLRVQEGVHLCVSDVDSGRMVVHVRQSKGRKDRDVPLPVSVLEMLRGYWVQHRHPVWLFPGRTKAGIPLGQASGPLSVSSVQKAFRAALSESGVKKCGQTEYRYHSCRNRHCPQCQHDKAQRWLEAQQDLLLPVPYFLLTCTLPEGLRPVARRHQRLVYDLLFRVSAEAIQQMGQDECRVGGQMGMMGVLHTWGRNLAYHPHVHYLAPGGGVAKDGRWRPLRANFLLPVKALSRVMRKFRDALRQADAAVFAQVPVEVWQQEWVVHCQPVGTGVNAVKYLAPYIPSAGSGQALAWPSATGDSSRSRIVG